MSVISPTTRADLAIFETFCGMDHDANLHLFRAANDADREAFASFMRAMAAAIQRDPRYRINERIRAAIEAAKEAGPC